MSAGIGDIVIGPMSSCPCLIVDVLPDGRILHVYLRQPLRGSSAIVGQIGIGTPNMSLWDLYTDELTDEEVRLAGRALLGDLTNET